MIVSNILGIIIGIVVIIVGLVLLVIWWGMFIKGLMAVVPHPPPIDRRRCSYLFHQRDQIKSGDGQGRSFGSRREKNRIKQDSNQSGL